MYMYCQKIHTLFVRVFETGRKRAFCSDLSGLYCTERKITQLQYKCRIYITLFLYLHVVIDDNLKYITTSYIWKILIDA